MARWACELPEAAGGPGDGIRFNSRWGDEIPMWAVFERAADGAGSRLLTPDTQPAPLADGLPELAEAFRLHGLVWAD